MRRAIVIVIGALLAACNALAGIEEGKLVREELVPDTSSADEGTSDDTGPAWDEKGGCSCDLPNAETTCKSAGGEAVCEIAKCDPGFADCNNDPSDGCETALDDPAHCGSCTTACSSTAPLCISDKKKEPTCGSGCTDKAPTRCGDKCVDLQRDPKNCGACGNACPGMPGGKAKCEQGQCTITCNKGHHLCSGACVKDDSVEQCGPSCMACPSAPNAVPKCAKGTCQIQCLPGWADCDGDAGNGCETWLDSPESCGACGRACYWPYVCSSGKCI